MRLAVIPARGGSKRIPRKNVKHFCGKPMIAWSISACLDAACFDRVIVSTDDPEIAEVAQKYGAEVPYMRPVELSDDHTGTIPVINHAIRALISDVVESTLVCCVYATAPFIRAEDIQRGLDIINQSQTDYAFAVTSYSFPIQRALRITESERITMFNPEQYLIRSQDLVEAWHDAGQFYWGRAEAWLSEIPVFSEAAAPVILPRYRVQDIDTAEDWVRAELMFRAIANYQEPV